MSLTLWEEKDNDIYNPNTNVGTITNNFPLISNFIPPLDHPLDPHNDLLPPGYATPLSNMMMGPPEVMHKRYFSLTLEDINKFKKEKIKKWIKVYEKVLGICFRRVRDHVLRDENMCLFTVPEFIPGFPVFNMEHCCAFIIRKLRLAGFSSSYYPKNSIIISWSPDPSYNIPHFNQPIKHNEAKRQVHKVHQEKEKDIHYITLEPQVEKAKNIVQPPVMSEPKRSSSRYASQREEPFLFQ